MKAANENIRQAAQLLMSITQHNDWSCKERDQINDYTTQNAKEIKEISEESENFTRAIGFASEGFRGQEKSVSESFDSIDGLLRDFWDKGKAIPITDPSVISRSKNADQLHIPNLAAQAAKLPKSKKEAEIRKVNLDNLNL